MSLRGETGWQATHQKAFGKERWRELIRSLRSPVTHVAWVNSFCSEEVQRRTRAEKQLRDHEHIPLVSALPDGSAIQGETGDLEDEDARLSLAAAEQTSANSVAKGQESTEVNLIEVPLNPIYYLDGASVVAALALRVKPGDAVLDLCSAPGGKALMLASLLFNSSARQSDNEIVEAVNVPLPEKSSEGYTSVAPPERKKVVQPAERAGLLVCNESSRPRCQRLRRNMASFLPPHLLAAGGQVHVTNCDAATASDVAMVPIQRLGPFDKILVDAPCTSDRHLAHQGASALSKWAAGAIKSNAERQLELLRFASTQVRRGGTILYCTCALSELENDGVVAKFLKKSANSFEVDREEESEAPDDSEGNLIPRARLPDAEQTAHGTLIMPDRSGYGPIYFARLRRL